MSFRDSPGERFSRWLHPEGVLLNTRSLDNWLIAVVNHMLFFFFFVDRLPPLFLGRVQLSVACSIKSLSSFPGSPEREMYTWRAWCLFSRDHDIIKIGPEFLEQKGNVLCVIQPTLRSTLNLYDIRPPIVIYVSCSLPSFFSLFWVFWYVHDHMPQQSV